MPAKTTPADSHARIIDYWNRRRHHLSEEEWTDFYQLVFPVLMSTQLPPEYADRRSRTDLVNMFFAEKIFMNAAASKAGPLQSVHALHEYLKRFAIDIGRRAGPSTALEDLPEWQITLDEDSDDMPGLTSCGQLLAEAGIDVNTAAHSAGVFVAGLSDGEYAYLRHHSCAEKEEQEPISAVAERLALGASYHYKAKKLGVTRSKGETYVGYEKTKIGHWLTSVGAQLNEEWREELAVLLIVLCLKVHKQLRRAA